MRWSNQVLLHLARQRSLASQADDQDKAPVAMTHECHGQRTDGPPDTDDPHRTSPNCFVTTFPPRAPRSRSQWTGSPDSRRRATSTNDPHRTSRASSAGVSRGRRQQRASSSPSESTECSCWTSCWFRRYAAEADAAPAQLADRVAADVAWLLRVHPGVPVHCIPLHPRRRPIVARDARGSRACASRCFQRTRTESTSWTWST